MPRPRCLDPELIVPISRSTTQVFRTGTWSNRRPVYKEKTSPCRSACPIGNDIPHALERASCGDFDAALAIFLQENPLPGVCGRVCYHPCQGQCNRSELDKAVSIRALEHAAADMGTAQPTVLTEAGRGQPVAVVGSGPAGLSAAYHLARMGHPVTLIERAGALGGMLRQAIPEYRLPEDVLERDLARILSLGIEPRTGFRVHSSWMRELLTSHGAVFLAVGAGKSRRPNIAGTGSRGVLSGLDLLKAVRHRTLTSVTGKVVVIGGGNVAIDAAMTAHRLGAQRVELVCLEQPAEMPAHERERQDGEEEGIVFRHGWGPRQIIERNGRAAGADFARCTSVFDEQGRFAPILDEAQIVTHEADWVILATGQEADLEEFRGEHLYLNADGTAQVDPDTCAASPPGLFAGGDAVSAPGSVAGAVAAGKRAAAWIHLSLNPSMDKKALAAVTLAGGKTFSMQALFSPRPNWDPQGVVRFDDLEPLYVDHRPPSPLPRLAAEERLRGFREINQSLSPDMATAEAGRCFFCGTCIACDRCLLFCPDLCIHPPDGQCVIYRPNDDYCKGCGVCAAVCARGVLTLGEGR